MVLAMIIGTTGSTYKKAGAMMLIDREGAPHGLLSGGCLEEDIAAHARRVAEQNAPARLHYDLDDDSPFGLGMGCRGAVDILMLPLHCADRYGPLTELQAADAADQPATLLIGVEPDAGAAFGRCELVDAAAPCPTGALRLAFTPRPQLLMVGAGMDAGPVHDSAAALRWRVTGYDHRSGLLTPERFPHADALVAGPPAAIAERLDLARYDAAVLMSHNIDHDVAYLRALATVPWTYIGLLGPASRRQEALQKAGLDEQVFNGALHGPAGLDIGGRQPESIALSIVAGIHQTLHQAGRLR